MKLTKQDLLILRKNYQLELSYAEDLNELSLINHYQDKINEINDELTRLG